jgi:hypothetical protein
MKGQNNGAAQPLLFAKRRRVEPAKAIQYTGTNTEPDVK